MSTVSRLQVIEQKLVGPTELCFAHFIDQFTGLDAVRLLAEFCHPEDHKNVDSEDSKKRFAGLNKVLSWQMGAYFPTGDPLLRLRCFLHLTGKYEVVEFKRLNGDLQTLAMIIATGREDPREIERRLGYQTSSAQPSSLWRILIRDGGGYPQSVARKIQALNEENGPQLARSVQDWQDRIEQLYQVLPKVSESVSQTPVIPHEIPAAFARLVTATVALGRVVSDDPGSRQAAIAATRGGSDAQELIGVLNSLFRAPTEKELRQVL